MNSTGGQRERENEERLDRNSTTENIDRCVLPVPGRTKLKRKQRNAKARGI